MSNTTTMNSALPSTTSNMVIPHLAMHFPYNHNGQSGFISGPGFGHPNMGHFNDG